MYKKISDKIRSKSDQLYYSKNFKSIERHSYDYEELKKEGFFSQCGQDKWVVEKLLPGLKDGVFVDIGANDGVSFSNTYFLEKLGWTGIAVEPNKYIYEKLLKSRNCTKVNACIGSKSGEVDFRIIKGYAQMLSGIIDNYDSRHLQRIENDLEVHGGSYEDVVVQCYNFNELLEKNNIEQVDYLSIDVEGAELGILKLIDFSKFKIKVIGVENNYDDSRIPKLLLSNGFRLHSKVGDEFYLNADFHL